MAYQDMHIPVMKNVPPNLKHRKTEMIPPIWIILLRIPCEFWAVGKLPIMAFISSVCENEPVKRIKRLV